MPSRFDRSIVEGPLRSAVWKLAWPTMLTNVIGGLQGIVDHVLVGHLVGFEGNAAIGVALQIFIVIGGASKLIPLTGLTLPLLSYGGSSLVANYALVAMLLRISNAARAPLPRRSPAPLPPLAEAGTELVERPS